MLTFNSQYKDLLVKIITQPTGINRTRGTESYYRFNESIYVDLRNEFPSLTLRNCYPESQLRELDWLINGQGLIDKIKSKTMQAIWSEYAANGIVEHSYYTMLREYGCNKIDQLARAVDKLKTQPMARDIIIDLYNPNVSGIKTQACCQSQVVLSSNGEFLDMLVLARSADVIFGLPSDIQVFAGLLKILSQKSALIARQLVLQMVNAHVYESDLQDAMNMSSIQELKTPEVDIVCAEDFNFTFKVKHYKHSGYKIHSKVNLGDLNYAI
jgi:thymidylate synthase